MEKNGRVVFLRLNRCWQISRMVFFFKLLIDCPDWSKDVYSCLGHAHFRYSTNPKTGTFSGGYNVGVLNVEFWTLIGRKDVDSFPAVIFLVSSDISMNPL